MGNDPLQSALPELLVVSHTFVIAQFPVAEGVPRPGSVSKGRITVIIYQQIQMD